MIVNSDKDRFPHTGTAAGNSLYASRLTNCVGMPVMWSFTLSASYQACRQGTYNTALLFIHKYSDLMLTIIFYPLSFIIWELYWTLNVLVFYFNVDMCYQLRNNLLSNLVENIRRLLQMPNSLYSGHCNILDDMWCG